MAIVTPTSSRRKPWIERSEQSKSQTKSWRYAGFETITEAREELAYLRKAITDEGYPAGSTLDQLNFVDPLSGTATTYTIKMPVQA